MRSWSLQNFYLHLPFLKKYKTMRLCCWSLLLLPFLLFTFYFPPSQSCFPSSYFLSCFSTLFIWAHQPQMRTFPWNIVVAARVCVCVCDPHQSTLTQWALCECTRFITPPLVTSLHSILHHCPLLKPKWCLWEDTPPSLPSSTYH